MFKDTEAFSGFAVDDLTEARRFYRNTLGIETTREAEVLMTLHLAGDRHDGLDQDEKGISRSEYGPPIAWFKDPAGNVLAVLEQR
jgi:extradiol dioxygenase family protein